MALRPHVGARRSYGYPFVLPPAAEQQKHYLDSDGNENAAIGYEWNNTSTVAQNMVLGSSATATFEWESFADAAQTTKMAQCPWGVMHFPFDGTVGDDGGTDVWFLDAGEDKGNLEGRFQISGEALDDNTTGDDTNASQNVDPVNISVNSSKITTSEAVNSSDSNPFWMWCALVLDTNSSGNPRKTLYVYSTNDRELVVKATQEGTNINNNLVDSGNPFTLFTENLADDKSSLFGGISFFRMWNKAFNQAEIDSHFHAGINSVDSDLLVNVEMEEGSGNPKDVITGNGPDSTSNTSSLTWKTR